MTYEEFWHGDPIMAYYYAEKYKLFRKRKNEEMWVNGIYTLNALQVALNNAFNKHKVDYIKKPFDIFPKTDMEIEMEKQAERKKLVKWLNSLIPKASK